MPITDDWRSFRELDEAAQQPKGTSFRAFRRLAPAWAEGCDYRVLDARRDCDAIRALREAGRIYPSTVNLVMLSPALAQAVLQALRQAGGDQ
jgi:hypothetical protein